MRTVYICDRGEKGLDPVAYASKGDAETWGREQQPEGETWTVRTFVEVDDAMAGMPDIRSPDYEKVMRQWVASQQKAAE